MVVNNLPAFEIRISAFSRLVEQAELGGLVQVGGLIGRAVAAAAFLCPGRPLPDPFPVNFFSFVQVFLRQVDLHLLNGWGAEAAVIAGYAFRGR